MNKKTFYIMAIIVLFFALCGILYYKTFLFKKDNISGFAAEEQKHETDVDEKKSEGGIVEISVDSVKGIIPKKAEELCYYVMGEKDEKTGFIFSFGVSGAVEKDKKQYYVVRASWLVNNSHLSYIGDFFVSADGKEVYSGTALNNEYVMQDMIWSE